MYCLGCTIPRRLRLVPPSEGGLCRGPLDIQRAMPRRSIQTTLDVFLAKDFRILAIDAV